MHRIASLPGDEPQEEITFIEQPSAPVIFLTSATSDITCLSSALKLNENITWEGKIRALPISFLSSNAVIDHYLSTTCSNSKIIVIRFLGTKSSWSYGFEQVRLWQLNKPARHLIVVSGTYENTIELNEISDLEFNEVNYIQTILNQGGSKNYTLLLHELNNILSSNNVDVDNSKIEIFNDIIKWRWKESNATSVGIILYKSLLQAGDTDFAESIINISEKYNLNPKVIWITSLKSQEVQKEIIYLFKKENIEAIITTTSFATLEYSNKDINNQLWDQLCIPVIQLITSTSSFSKWNESSVGLNPIDLSIQIVLPELDGRICTVPGAFKNLTSKDTCLSTSIYRTEPFNENIDWCINYIQNSVKLKKLKNINKKISLILANYPIKDSRLANGVGLDTPESVLYILRFLKQEGYYLGDIDLPDSANEIIQLILSKRTNSCESINNTPQDYISLSKYLEYWNKFNSSVKKKIINRWGKPLYSKDLEDLGFAVNGISFGNISIVIQANRGFESDNLIDLHSPDLPPTHKYIAQYIWVSNVFKADAVVHIGKHGSVEWLPGKGVGLSSFCFPHIICPPVPNIYPFIVNDPGEGSQAKRRTHAIIIDHLTPPLSNSDSYSQLVDIENLIDEYYESMLISDDRKKILEDKIINILVKQSWPGVEDQMLDSNSNVITSIIDQAESYLCEIKNSQIRTGLHVFGNDLSNNNIVKLATSIANVPNSEIFGLSQSIANDLGFIFDPWSDEDGEDLCDKDKNLYNLFTNKTARKKGKVSEWIYNLSSSIVDYHLSVFNGVKNTQFKLPIQSSLLDNYSDYQKPNIAVNYLIKNIIPKLIDSPSHERLSFINALNGLRVRSGPSGAPTRGKLEVLPTGKNFYSVDIRAIPTETAWDLGKRSSERIIEFYLQENGEHLTHLAMSIWGTSTMRNGGEDICQLFALMGLQPVWDGTLRRVIDLDIIPLGVLNRPRVDVTLRISGFFRDAFPHVIDLIKRGQMLIGYLDEPESMNPLAASFRNGDNNSRIYGSAPGSYGAGLQEIINSGSWENNNDLAEAFIQWSKWRYEGSNNIVEDKKGLVDNLSKVKVVLHSQDNREHDILDSDDYYQFHGGLISAVKKSSGINPEALFADNSRYSRPRIHKLSKEIDKVARSRLFNPKWIEGMKSHGYKGAFEMSASLDYLFSFDATTNLVPDWCYHSITNSWLEDKNTFNFLNENNPWALRDIAERLLEAKNRGLWSRPTSEDISIIKNILSEVDSKIEGLKYKD